jgi:hypothetical protein
MRETPSFLMDQVNQDQTLFGLGDTAWLVDGVDTEKDFHIELGFATGSTAKTEEGLRSKCRDSDPTGV